MVQVKHDPGKRADHSKPRRDPGVTKSARLLPDDPSQQAGVRSARSETFARTQARDEAEEPDAYTGRAFDDTKAEQQERCAIDEAACVKAVGVDELEEGKRRPEPRNRSRDGRTWLADRPSPDPPDENRRNPGENDRNHPQCEPAAPKSQKPGAVSRASCEPP